MACEIQYQQYIQTRSAADKQIYDDCLNRASSTAAEERRYASQQAAEDRKAALYSQIHSTSAQLAQSRLPTNAPNYTALLQSGAQYSAPSGPGFFSRTTSGIGQGILIFGILAGGVLVMMLMFYMVRPKTVQQLPGFKRKKKRKR
jgi:hypothetical protein